LKLVLTNKQINILLAMLVGHQEEHRAYIKLSDEVLAGLSVRSDGANDLRMVQLTPLPPHHLLLH